MLTSKARHLPFLLAFLALCGVGFFQTIPTLNTFSVSSNRKKSTVPNIAQGPKIIIIGAGIAGLTAANHFAKSGKEFQVQILEASDRIGGRIQKLDNFADYFPVDLGASLVHDPKWFQEIAEEDVSRNIQTEYLNAQYEGQPGKSLLVNSTWYDFLDQYLAPDPRQIVYNCPVDKVYYDSIINVHSIRVHSGRDHAYYADAVIVTTPLPTLMEDDIIFFPNLANYIHTYPGTMWAGIKVIFEFKEKFYPEYFDWKAGSVNDKENPGKVEFWDYASVNSGSRNHILAGHFIGTPAMKFMALKDKAICQAILTKLDEKFGNNVATDNYIKHKIVNWSNRPFIRGAHSSFASEQWHGAQMITERLYLAGEAFPGGKDQEAGWAHSAALSGKDAASSLIQRYFQ